MMITRAGIIAAAAFVLCGPAWAEDPARGRALAEKRCSECHNIDGGPRRRGSRAPSFSEFARQAGFSASQLAIHLAYAHTPMGDGHVTLGEAGDLSAYIMTLRRR